MFHALIYNSKNIRRNKKYYAYSFLCVSICMQYIQTFLQIKKQVYLLRNMQQKKGKYIVEKLSFFYSKKSQEPDRFLTDIFNGKYRRFFFSFDTNSEYFAQFFNFYIQILSSRLQCKIPVDILLINMDWNKTRQKGYLKEESFGYFYTIE